MLVSRFYHDDLGMMPAFHMLGLRESLRGYCFRMMQDFVVHLVFLQTIDQSFWDFHNRLRGKKYHFPRLSLVPGQSRWNAPFRIFAPSALSRLLKAAERCAFQDASAWQTRATIPAFWSAALLHRFRSTRCSYVSAIEKSQLSFGTVKLNTAAKLTACERLMYGYMRSLRKRIRKGV